MKYTYILMASAFFIILAWLFALLPFEIPDEQSHFASVSYLVRRGEMPKAGGIDLSQEERDAQYIFGVMTDGTNQYAFRPDRRIEYSTTTQGLRESEIESLNTPILRNAYTIHQAAIYPPLYYMLASIPYRLVDNGGLITRLFVTRFISLLFVVISTVVSYRIGKLIFDSEAYARTLTILTLLYPMTTFIAAGVNPDNLHNLFFFIFTYYMVKYVIRGWSSTDALATGIVIGLDLLCKPQAYIMVPIALIAIFLKGDKAWKNTLRHAGLALAMTILIAGFQEIPNFVGGTNAYLASGDSGTTQSVVQFVVAFLKKSINELLVWQWGVFKWSTVILPRFWWWTANRILLIAGIGVALMIVRSFKQSKTALFFILSNCVYMAALVFYDWQYYQQTGTSLGFQARYFMPLLPTQLALIIMGIRQLGWNDRVKEWARKALILFFVGLQLAAVTTVLSSYYDTSSLNSLIVQISQYKPQFAKGSWWYLWFGTYAISLFHLTWTALISRGEIEADEKMDSRSHSTRHSMSRGSRRQSR